MAVISENSVPPFFNAKLFSEKVKSEMTENGFTIRIWIRQKTYCA